MKTRIIAALLALALAFSLVSCTGTKKPERAKVDHVFSSTSIELADSYELIGFSAVGERITALAHEGDRRVVIDIADGESIERELEISSGEEIVSYGFFPDGAGVFLLCAADEDSKRSDYPLVLLEGDKLTRLSEDITAELGATDGSLVPNSLAIAEDGTICVASRYRLIGFDRGLNKLFELDVDGGIKSMCADAYGEIIVGRYDSNRVLAYVKLDTENRKFTDAIAIPDDILSSGELFFGAGHDFYLRTALGVSFYDSGDREPTLMLDFINSDLMGHKLKSLSVVSQDRLLGWYRGYDSTADKSESELLILDRVPANELPERYIVTLAAIAPSLKLIERIVDFNRENDEYRIVIDDYDRFNDEGSKISCDDALRSALTSKNSPDIVMMSDFDSAEEYASNRTFADLYPYIEKSLGRDKFFASVLDSFESNGELYAMPTSLTMRTLVGKRKNLPERWNAGELASFALNLPDGEFLLFTDYYPTKPLELALTLSLDRYIDVKTGKCSFDGEDFRLLLEFAADYNLPKNDYYGSLDASEKKERAIILEQRAYASDKVMLRESNIASVSAVKTSGEIYFGDECVAVGYACESGSGAMLIAEESFAIVASSAVKDGAWMLIESLLKDGERDGFSPLVEAFESDAARELGVYTTDGVTINKYSGKIPDGFTKFEVTESDIATVRKLIEGASRPLDSDGAIRAIIDEESYSYLLGDKGIDETVKLIGDRVSTYVSENY